MWLCYVILIFSAYIYRLTIVCIFEYLLFEYSLILLPGHQIVLPTPVCRSRCNQTAQDWYRRSWHQPCQWTVGLLQGRDTQRYSYWPVAVSHLSWDRRYHLYLYILYKCTRLLAPIYTSLPFCPCPLYWFVSLPYPYCCWKVRETYRYFTSCVTWNTFTGKMFLVSTRVYSTASVLSRNFMRGCLFLSLRRLCLILIKFVTDRITIWTMYVSWEINIASIIYISYYTLLICRALECLLY